MKYNNMITVANARVATYDHSSKLAMEFPGEDLFTSARDLKILGKTDHIALLADFGNLLSFKNTPRGIDTTLTLSLTDTDSERLLCCRLLPLKMKPSEACTRRRINFPIDFDHSNPMLRYNIRISAENGECLLDIPFRLYDLTLLKLLPTRFYSPLSAAITSCGELAPKKTPGKDFDCLDNYLHFALSSPLPHSVELPELQLRLVKPDGTEVCSYVSPQRNTGPDSDCAQGDINVRVLLDIDCESPRGEYYAELLSMGYPIAGMVFSTEGEAVEGLWTGADTEPIRNYTPAAARQRLQGILHPHAPATMPERGIDDLIGLKSVKTRLKAYTDLVRFNRMRGEHGLPQMPLSLHAMFLGSPGTGKTTVAKIIGRTLRDIGVLSSGHVVVRERATLLGKYYNSEAENVRKALDEARGGILFIDEAYQLHQPDDPKDPGKFVIETLLTALADDSDRDWMLILAGYSEPMKRMFDMNPGLRSRIPPGNIYHFDDFNPDELMQIALAHLARYRFTLTREAGMALKKRLDADYAARRADFGNARHVVSMIENEILPSMARRLCNTNAPDAISLSRIVAADIPAAQPLIAPAVRRLGFAV